MWPKRKLGEKLSKNMYRPTIGLEIHVELKTKTKMFCSCLNNPDEKRPNFNVCPICLGHPGTLPVINEEAVAKVIKTGLALNCQIPKYAKFDRKNYFYPDLPKGYQISQYDKPLCLEGYLEIPLDQDSSKKIRIKRIHLEEDTGSLSHLPEENCSLVNFNRAGVPLMELVTEPDMVSAKEARQFAEDFHLIMHYLDVSDADMEKGQMRVEVNISLSEQEGKLGTKAEIKNLNSFRAVEGAIEYEIKRQTEILESGGRVLQETRGWDDMKGITISQREKEEAHDYRYLPEPDLPGLSLSNEFIQGIKSKIPELPQNRKNRLIQEYSLNEKEAEIFVYYKDLGEYFEKVISELPSGLTQDNLLRLIKLTANYLISDLQGLLKGQLVTDKTFFITPENFAEFITLIHEDKISSKIAKMVLLEMFKSGADPSNIVEEQGLSQITDKSQIENVVQEVVSQNEKVVQEYLAGKETVLQFLVGQVMAKTKGRVNPQLAQEALKEALTKIR